MVKGAKHGQWRNAERELSCFFHTGKATKKMRSICPVCGERIAEGEIYARIVADYYRGYIQWRRFHWLCLLGNIDNPPTHKILTQAKKYRVLSSI